MNIVCASAPSLALHQPKLRQIPAGDGKPSIEKFPNLRITSSIFLIAILQPPSPSACLTLSSLSSRALSSPSTFQWQTQGWRFYWRCWSSHFISSSIPLTCQHPSCRRRGSKPAWWIATFPIQNLRVPPSPVVFSSISIHRTQIPGGEGPNQEG